MVHRFLFFLTILIPPKIWGQTPFTNYLVKDGLASNECYKVAQGNLGFIWIATPNGLSRFDGYSFKNYNTRDGLPVNEVLDIWLDSKGRLWLKPLHYQPTYIEDGVIHKVELSNKLKDELDDYFIRRIQETKSGNIIVVYHSELVFEYDTRTAEFKKIIDFSNEERYTPCFVKSRDFGYLITSGGKIKPENEYRKTPYLFDYDKSKKYPLKNEEDLQTHKKVISNYLIKDSNLIFHLIPDSSLYLVSNDSISILKKYKTSINRFFGLDNNNQLWVGTSNNGLYLYSDKEGGNDTKNILNGYSVTSRFIDREGNSWFSTISNGVFFTPNENLKYYPSEEFNSSKIRTIAGIEGAVFISTKEMNLYSLNRDSVKYIESNVLNVIDRDDTSIFISRTSLDSSFSFNGIDKSFYKNVSIESYHQFDSFEFIGLRRRIFYQDLNSDSSRLYNLKAGKFIYDISDYNESIIVGTEQGILELNYNLFADSAFDCSACNTTLVPSNYSPLEGKVSAIERLGEFLVFTKPGNGVYFFHNDSLQIQFLSNDENKDDFYNGLYLSNKGELYSYGKNGFVKYLISADSINRIVYREIDGIGWSGINDMYVFNDTVWLASNRGICKLNFDQISIPLVKPEIIIEKFLVNNESYDPFDEIELEPAQNNIECFFIGLLYRDQGNLKYYYQVNNKGWVEVKTHSISFPDLKYGNYSLKLKAVDSWGQSSNVSAISFNILPPLYLRWWFVLIMLLLAASAVYLFVKWWVTNLKQAAMVKLEKYQNKHLALNAQLNPHFIFNSLNSIEILVKQKEIRKSSEYLRSFARLMRQTMENSKVQLVKLETDLELLKEYVRLEQFLHKKDFKVVYDIDESLELKRIFIPPMLLQPYIENAFQHAWHSTDRKRVLKIGVRKLKKEVNLYVSDNGLGIQKSNKRLYKNVNAHISSGMTISNARVELLNNLYNPSIDIIIESVIKKGTTVSIHIPYELELKPIESIK